MCFVFADVMVIPKERRLRVADMSCAECGKCERFAQIARNSTHISPVDPIEADLFNTARLVGQQLEQRHFTDVTSLQFSIQDGPDSGQSVEVTQLIIRFRRSTRRLIDRLPSACAHAHIAETQGRLCRGRDLREDTHARQAHGRLALARGDVA
jgi:hypothetical protein